MTRRLLGPVGGPVLFFLVAALVFGGLGWVTVASLRVEQDQRETAARAELEANVRLALWRLDGRLLPAFGVENNRSFYAYAPADPEGFYGQPSDLLTGNLPDWMRLHFQLDAESGWESPQVIPAEVVGRLRDTWTGLNLRNVTQRRAERLVELRRRHPAGQIAELFAARARAVVPGSAALGSELFADDNLRLVIPVHPADAPLKPAPPDGINGLPPVTAPPTEATPETFRPNDREMRLPEDLAESKKPAAAQKQESADLRRKSGDQQPGPPAPAAAPPPQPVPTGDTAGQANKRGEYDARAGVLDRAFQESKSANPGPITRTTPYGQNGNLAQNPATNNSTPAAPAVPAGPGGPPPGDKNLAQNTPAPGGVSPGAGGGGGGLGSSPGGSPGRLGAGRPGMPAPPGAPGPAVAGGFGGGAPDEKAPKDVPPVAKAVPGFGVPAPLVQSDPRNGPAGGGAPGGAGPPSGPPAAGGIAGGKGGVTAAPGAATESKPSGAAKKDANSGALGAEKEKDEKEDAAKKLAEARKEGLFKTLEDGIKQADRNRGVDALKRNEEDRDARRSEKDAAALPTPAAGVPPAPVAPPGPPMFGMMPPPAPVPPAVILPFVPAPPPIAVHLGSIRPQWLTAADGTEVLVLVRPAKLENKTVYQGVVLDWPRLQEVLKDEVKDLFPDAKLLAVKDPAGVSRERAMTALPVQLDPGPTPEPAPAGWSPLRFGLVLAWVAAIVAFAAVGFSGWSLIDLAERRIRFVSAVTHELRTPLTSLRLYLDLLVSGMVQDETKRQEYLSTLAAESDRLHRLIDNVLDFARLEKRRKSAGIQTMKVCDLLEQIRQTWADRCGTDGKELVVISTLPPGGEVCADPSLIQQIVGNLIDNARKYTRDAADRRIWLWAKPGGRRRVVFEVEDRGPGVAKAERKLIFRPFRRGETADTTAGGAGLGLALAKQWAELLGGRLTYRPADGGTGACFRLELRVK